MSVCFCTLAINEPYIEMARKLAKDLHPMPLLVLTNKLERFGKDVRNVTAIHHDPTGPMARDYLAKPGLKGPGGGTAAYHDKRFVLRAALRTYTTAIFLDADHRVSALPKPSRFPPGLSLRPGTEVTIDEHLKKYGPERRPLFENLGHQLLEDSQVLKKAFWCPESCYAITVDSYRQDERFFYAWDIAVQFMGKNRMFSGEGGVMGLAAAYARWKPNFSALEPVVAVLKHVGGGPKR